MRLLPPTYTRDTARYGVPVHKRPTARFLLILAGVRLNPSRVGVVGGMASQTWQDVPRLRCLGR